MEIVIKSGKPTDWYWSHTNIRYHVVAKPNHGSYYLVNRPGHGDDLVHEDDCEEVGSCPDSHYDNKNGSLYKFAEDHGLNSWEFDIIKRVTRCRKKGQFKEDLEKTKRVIDLYLSEHENSN